MPGFLRHPLNVAFQYKKGILLIDGIETEFKYHKMSNTDIDRTEMLRNIAMQQNQVLIKTTSDKPFNVQSFVVINHDQYSIDYMYLEDSFNENNVFNFKVDTPVRYLLLTRVGPYDTE